MFVTALSEPEITVSHLRDARRLVTDAAYSFIIALFYNVSLGWLTLL